MDGARRVLSQDFNIIFAKRVITRPRDSSAEDHDAVSVNQFNDLRQAGDFMLNWAAHGLKYGIPAQYSKDLAAGRQVVANVSRSVIGEATARYSPTVVIEVTASAENLSRRIGIRGREQPDEMGARLARTGAAIPVSTIKKMIVNDGTPEDGIRRFVAAVQDTGPDTKQFFDRKLKGEALKRDEYGSIIRDIVGGLFNDQEIADFLVSVVETLTVEETTALAKARTEQSPPLEWAADIVVDKHSMGGIPGSRITMVVVPLVAAYGLTIPKTSSRAITSPAGTADTMEVLARVDLDNDDVRRVVSKTNGCIAWNGRLNHSRIDDVMNTITRPRKLNTLRWSVASILSKKTTAGITHCVIDVPYGPTAKVHTEGDAKELQSLFMQVGKELGLHLDVRLTDGHAPIGHGIGPVLEARDVVATLKNTKNAPADLREKSLQFAAAILTFDPSMSKENADIVVRNLLDSGKAYETFERMLSAQGPPPENVRVGGHTATVKVEKKGVIQAIDCFTLAGIALAAGCPADKGAGLDLCARVGDYVDAGAPLYHLYASTEQNLAFAHTKASLDSAFRIKQL